MNKNEVNKYKYTDDEYILIFFNKKKLYVKFYLK